MTISTETFLFACKQFPDSSNLVQRYSINQVRHLNRVRKRREHLHPNNFATSTSEEKEAKAVRAVFSHF